MLSLPSKKSRATGSWRMLPHVNRAHMRTCGHCDENVLFEIRLVMVPTHKAICTALITSRSLQPIAERRARSADLKSTLDRDACSSIIHHVHEIPGIHRYKLCCEYLD